MKDKDVPEPAKAKEDEESLKRGRGRPPKVRVSSESNNEESTGEPSTPAAKRAKIEVEQPEEDEEVTTVTVVHLPQEQEGGDQGVAIQPHMVQLEDTQITQVQMMETSADDDSQIFEAVAKMNAEAAAANAVQIHHVGEEQQRSAVDSILSDNNTITVGTIIQNADGTQYIHHQDTDEHITTVVEVNPPWNEQGCIICNVDISIDDPTNQAPKSEQLKDFFLEFFSVGDQISLEDENAFPFCSNCAKEMDELLTVSQNIESMHKQFNKVRDSMAKKAIKTFLIRTKPNCLEEDAKQENYGFLDEEQKKSYKDSMFQRKKLNTNIFYRVIS